MAWFCSALLMAAKTARRNLKRVSRDDGTAAEHHDDDEVITEVKPVHLEECLAVAARGEIHDAKTLCWLLQPQRYIAGDDGSRCAECNRLAGDRREHAALLHDQQGRPALSNVRVSPRAVTRRATPSVIASASTSSPTTTGALGQRTVSRTFDAVSAVSATNNAAPTNNTLAFVVVPSAPRRRGGNLSGGNAHSG